MKKDEKFQLMKQNGKILIENYGKLDFSNNSEFWKHGPSWFFYKEIMDQHKKREIVELLEDRYFLVLIYSALASWGLDRMGKGGPKMRDFEPFRDEILKNKEEIITISKLDPMRCKDSLREKLLFLFDSLLISENKNKTKIVANSKTMHFLLPKQAPIVDREYIIRYFMNNPNVLNPSDEREFYSELIDIYFKILSDNQIHSEDPLREIDKVIVNFIRKTLNRKN